MAIARLSTETESARAFFAFVSYSHADSTFANWLHRKLEDYVMPEGIGNGKPMRPIFIDRAELVAGDDLSAQVRDALLNSAALIVVASPKAKASRWVAQEIALFRSLHPDRSILIALESGEPDESFPLPLLEVDGLQQEPIAADFRRDGDGRRLGLLKLVAGLAKVPLDRLVQRDAQKRGRRVMAVTVFALAITIMTTALAIAAVRSRNEAQRQRNGSEALVEFMLTDLRQKLKGVGRLDVMDAVNTRAMSYYAGEQQLGSLPDESVERRARLLTAMGEDDAAKGNLDAAQPKFAEAYRNTADLMRRTPNDPERVFNHAQSEYWLGYVGFRKKDRQTTQKHWLAYRDLALRMTRLDKTSIKYRQELGSAEINLCALALSKPKDPPRAVQHCRAAGIATRIVAEASPNDLQSQISSLRQIAWAADAEVATGNVSAALALRRQQNFDVEKLVVRFPADARVAQAQMLAAIGLGETLNLSGQHSEARKVAEQARSYAAKLHVLDPDNQMWVQWSKQIDLISTNVSIQ